MSDNGPGAPDAEVSEASRSVCEAAGPATNEDAEPADLGARFSVRETRVA